MHDHAIPTGWRKSSRSSQVENCVEVGQVGSGGAAVRDTKDRAAGYFAVTNDQWASFIHAVKSGKFDQQ